MQVLLTGLPGWLGNRFLEVLTKGFEGEGPVRDWKIRCLLFQPLAASFSKDGSNVEYVFGDVTKKDSLRAAVGGVDVVFHAVGIIHPQRVSEFYQINTLGTENLLSVSSDYGVKKFIYLSSNSVGGTQVSRGHLLTEDEAPRPYLNYGISKYRAECAVNDYHRRGKLETVILRPCWYYGPGQPDRQTKFFQMIRKGNPIIFGKGDNLRSMSYLDNVCQAMLLAAEKERAAGQTYWIADARPYPINEIYETIAQLFGVRHFKPRRVPDWISEGCFVLDQCLQRLGCYQKEIHVAGEMNKNIACSIKKAERELGYHPRVSLREGMQRSIEWCRQNRVAI